MTKAVSNKDICFISAVLLLWEHGRFSLNLALHELNSPILLGLNERLRLSMDPDPAQQH